VIVIGVLVMAGILYSRARSRRNAELRLTQDEVARLAAMAERERIGRDLHDLLGHTLSVVALKSELAGRLVDRDPAGAKAQIAEVETVARQALSQVREAVAGIRAAGLQAELAAARLALLSADVRLDQRLAPVAVAAEAESALAMAVREAVTNVLRHADASRVDVELGTFDGELRLSISDDGRGGATTPGTGLSGMRERLAAVGGRLEIDSPEGEGTRLLITLPRTVIAGPAP
jgi:two-component system sensor histidine kinase DesK